MELTMAGRLNKRRCYDDDYKRETVRRLRESGQPVSVFARHAGIEQSVLHRWTKQYETTSAASFLSTNNTLSDAEVEIRTLRKEIASIRQSVRVLRSVVEKAFREKYGSDFLDDKNITRLFGEKESVQE